MPTTKTRRLGLLDMPVEVIAFILENVFRGQIIEIDQPHQLQSIKGFASLSPELGVLAVEEIISKGGKEAFLKAVIIKAPILSILLLRSPKNQPELPQIRNLSVQLRQFQHRGGFPCLVDLVLLKKLVLRFSVTRVVSADTETLDLTGVKYTIVRWDKDINALRRRWAALTRAEQDYCVVLQITLSLGNQSAVEACTVGVSGGKIVDLECSDTDKQLWRKQIVKDFDLD